MRARYSREGSLTDHLWHVVRVISANPASHGWHSPDVPSELIVPDAHALHDVLPASYRPAVHRKQVACPSSEIDPLSQARHAEFSAFDLVPAEQGLQTSTLVDEM